MILTRHRTGCQGHFLVMTLLANILLPFWEGLLPSAFALHMRVFTLTTSRKTGLRTSPHPHCHTSILLGSLQHTTSPTAKQERAHRHLHRLTKMERPEGDQTAKKGNRWKGEHQTVCVPAKMRSSLWECVLCSHFMIDLCLSSYPEEGHLHLFPWDNEHTSKTFSSGMLHSFATFLSVSIDETP